MKKINGILILALIILSTFVVAADYTTPDKKAIRVKNTRYDPFPVEPGAYFDLWIRLENFGFKDASNLRFKLKPEYPFSLDPNENELREIGDLNAGEQVMLQYKVRADVNAVERSNPLHYEYSTGTQWYKAQFNVEIYTLDAILSIADVKMEKDRIAPGEEVETEIVLENLADSTLKDINIKLNFIDVMQSAAAAQVIELPISPIGSGDEKTIKVMEGRAKESVKFKLIVDPSAESAVYKIPMTITYNDMQGVNYTKETLISMVVGSEPDLAVTIDSSTANMKGKVGEIIVKFVNKGFSEIKFLYVTLEDCDDFEVISPKEVYLGNVDSDDYETAEYQIYVKGGNGDIKVPLTIEYKDTNNKGYTQKMNLINRVYSSSEAKRFGIVEGGGIGGILIVVLIVGGGLYGYKKWKKRKKKK